jgi:hypothetical protein
MKGFFAATFFVLASSLLSISALAQASPNEGPAPSIGPTNGNYPELRLPGSPVGRPNPPTIHQENRVLEQGLLAPSSGDRVALAVFLRTRNTGLIRLLPREIYDNPRNKKGELAIRGGGAYYSFTTLTHVYGYGSDIELQQDKLLVGFAGADYGMLTNLGDVSLENISRQDPRADFISTYKPPGLELQARAEARRFHLGVKIDGVLYRRSLPVEENATYLLRSIGYDRSDVLVALRVVRKDTDGSVIIAWKLLKKYPAPTLSK